MMIEQNLQNPNAWMVNITWGLTESSGSSLCQCFSCHSESSIRSENIRSQLSREANIGMACLSLHRLCGYQSSRILAGWWPWKLNCTSKGVTIWLCFGQASESSPGAESWTRSMDYLGYKFLLNLGSNLTNTVLSTCIYYRQVRIPSSCLYQGL
jgi:hypothetical protein